MGGFTYLWIIRCGGSERLNRNVEYKLIREAPNDIIIPLVEVINENNFGNFHYILKGKYGEVWVDLPYYLAEHSNSFESDVIKLKSRYISPRDFFLTHKNYVDVPVISAPFSHSFDQEKKFYESIKEEFDKIAVRIRVPTYDISNILDSFNKLIKAMRPEDVLLLDVFRFSRVESQIVSNIRKIIRIARQKNIDLFILNAFDTKQENCHNYGPLLTAYFSLNGFGDFATDERYRSKGGSGASTKIIRYYDPSSFTLRFFTEKTTRYEGAKEKLISSGYWATISDSQHQKRCRVCREVANNLNRNDPSYWRRFRILHYLNCLVHETVSQYYSANTPEDLDPDGYNVIVNLQGEEIPWQ